MLSQDRNAHATLKPKLQRPICACDLTHMTYTKAALVGRTVLTRLKGCQYDSVVCGLRLPEVVHKRYWGRVLNLSGIKGCCQRQVLSTDDKIKA